MNKGEDLPDSPYLIVTELNCSNSIRQPNRLMVSLLAGLSDSVIQELTIGLNHTSDRIEVIALKNTVVL